ncbi:MAG TPA: 1,4-dihydroxy-2-naphthoate polyprenyltransferase [Actinomycetes bacterium]
MVSVAEWVAGARPRTLPAAVAPVAVGTGAAAAAGAAAPGRALLALVVALALQVGVNYANDYSDGIRGTDADRVGPFRLVGSGTAQPDAVRLAAFASFAVAAAAGLWLAALASWWLIAVGAAALAAAWFYTGGPRPYGYHGLGEAAVFVFFGLVAVVGTAYVQCERITGLAVASALPIGLLACALLLTNNLRDIPTDLASGKRTLAVRLGDRRTRLAYVGAIMLSFAIVIGIAIFRPWALLALLAAPLAMPPVRRVLSSARGAGLIPVLKETGRLQLVFGLLLAIGLTI